MKHDHIPPARLDAVKNVSQVIEIKVIADGHKNISRPHAQGLWTEFAFQLKVELIHFHMSHSAVFGAALGKSEHNVQDHGKNAAGDCGYRLCEQVRDRDSEQRERNQPKTHRNLHAANMEVQRNLELALARTPVTQDQHGQAIHRETPDHAKGVQIREESNVAATD